MTAAVHPKLAFRFSVLSGGGTTFDVQNLLAKKRVNEALFYLVLWEGYREPTWEPEKNIRWQLRRRFEADHINEEWSYQSTRGRRRPEPRSPVRRSTRNTGN